MFKNIPIFFTICCISAQMIQTNKPILLQLTPEQIRDTFDNVMSDEYIRILAKDFATKAAEHFVNEMRNQKNTLASKLGQIYRSPVSGFSAPKLQAQIQALQSAQVQAQAQALAQAQAQAQVQAQVQAQDQAKAQQQVQAQATVQAQAQQQAQAQAQQQAQQKANLQQYQNNQLLNNQLKDLLDSHEALNLLKDPEPDGDHLDSQSGELSGEATRDKIPVIQVMKINGAYYRRLLGVV